MSDFRIQLPYEFDPDYDLELDWENQKNLWSLSEKEKGLGHAWEKGSSLTDVHIRFLYNFFRIPTERYNASTIINLSPGELAFIHAQTTIPTSIYATLCSDCGQHWKIYRWDFEDKKWRIFGRNCDYSWYRGIELDIEDEQLLSGLRGSLNEPGATD